ncbi:hypothetical protein CDCA_CDCA12G3390 [Cyanidium caldarium]|uniref:Phosphotyrosine protein phosphatase I domain-containing protein n=1 Tax=Cyanidium caldarium TaxID=2771 RepID=A0AAV9IYG3_CYACA|nr:hypothetical protein CDCA_CDCA12G3390 [Cyanidium caldarium]
MFVARVRGVAPLGCGLSTRRHTHQRPSTSCRLRVHRAPGVTSTVLGASARAATVVRRMPWRATSGDSHQSHSGDKYGILTVCLGNLCRSPTAEALLKKLLEERGLAERVFVDSCGTGGGNPDWYVENGWSYHEGDAADPRMVAAAAKRGVKISSTSRPLRPDDLERFDLIVGMDDSNVREIRRAAVHWGERYQRLADQKVHLVTEYCRKFQNVRSVPDPWYGGAGGFERVLDLLEDACVGLVETLPASLKEARR